jgi:D-alanyl-D-alanine carboxypeptidase/D-alanyl-D-alanine-endopeptidase (penicillin-binding protein 4)
VTGPDSGIEGVDQDGSTAGERPGWDMQAGGDVVRPGTDVVRPGTGVVRPGTGVVRPGTGVVRPGSASVEGAAKAVAAVPDAPEKPLEPIHVVLPVIPVKPVKQGFLDRLVAGKTDAEKAEEAARKAEEAARKETEAQRKAEERARTQAEDAARKEADAQRKADERARKAADDAAREEAEERERAEAKAAEAARKSEERARKAEEKARRAEEKALRRSRGEDVDEDEYDDDDEDYDEPVAPRGFAGPAAPPRPAPPPVAPPMPSGPMAPPRPGPTAPPRPGPPGTRPAPARPMPPAPQGRPQRMPERGYDRRYDDRYDERYEDERPRARARRPWWHWVAAAAALGALGAGSATVAGSAVPPEVVQYRAGIDIGAAAPLVEALGAGAAPTPTRGGLQSTLGPLFADGRLGSDVAGSVVDGETGELLWDQAGGEVMTPASTAKVITAAAVLAARGPTYQIPTRVVQGSAPGEVVIIGGGDPTLAGGPNGSYPGAARLDDLAQQVRTALGGTNPTRVIVDSSLFTGPSVHPSWASADLSAGHNAAITALMTDGARVNPADTGRSNTARHADPHLAAGRQFAQALGFPDLPVVAATAPAGARLLGEVLSLPIARMVELMLVFSDNVVAELLARQVALAKNLPASFTGAAQAIAQALADIGVPPTAGLGLADGSGLSNDNRVSANQLTAVLARAASPEHPQLRAVLSGLPVAGFYGSLLNRSQGAGRGLVRAKTGTLTGVNALAGYVVDADGRLLIFAVLANGTGNDWWNTEAALDRIAEGVSRCGCQ